ncbi:MAG TPA: hypothetical protein VND91_07915 [Candidatus Saccharimonadia bacterium]|nr:hypothetical protein [Candidatus Saccharimonadia bacterium]
MRPLPIVVALTLLVAGPCAHAWDACEFTAPRTLDLAANGVDTLVVRAKAGSLEIRAAAGESIAARGTACASDAKSLEAIRLVQSREGRSLVLSVEIPEDSGDGWNNVQRALDLDITVPARLALQVQDSSGDATIRGVASVTVQDSSGDLRIDAIAGNVVVTDSSGEIDVRDVGGDVRIPADSSGDITARNVRGTVEVEQDSSGSISLSDIGGDALVGVDSSGEIEFARITGSARVDRDSSGGIEADDIGRDFVVRADGSGGISHDGVRGRVDIPPQD